MPQLLSVFRAARLVGITRSALQKRIHDGELNTFEGQVDLKDLLRLFPETEVGYDTEYERIQTIKSQAFAKRVRERILPNAEVLADRLVELGRELATTHTQLSGYQAIVSQLHQTLSKLHNSPTTETLGDVIHWLENSLATLTADDDNTQHIIAQQRITQHFIAKEVVLRIMAAHITIKPSNHEYWLEGNDTLLDAGVRSGLALNYGCTSGNCGLCKARVISGETKEIQHHDYVLSEAEKNSNYILMCSCTAVSDVTLEALEAADENDIPQQEIVTKVKSVDQSHPDILILHVQTPRTQRLRFLAGQSVNLSLPNGMSADLPIASCPCDDRNIIFHLSQKDSLPIVEHIAENTKKGDDMTVNGPHGHFLFQEKSPRAPIFLAYGTGFAPIKSLIEHAMALEIATDMNLYWVAENEEALYAHNLCRSWDDALEEFSYHPVIAQDPVKQLLVAHGNLTDIDIYLAGLEENVNDAGQRLLAAGLSDEQLISVSL